MAYLELMPSEAWPGGSLPAAATGWGGLRGRKLRPQSLRELPVLLEIGGEADAAALRPRVHELADRGQDGGDGLIVVLVLALELIELAREPAVGGEEFAQLHEGAHDIDAHLDGPGAVEDGGGHDGAVLGEGEGRQSRIAVLLGTGRKMRPVQRLDLGAGEAEHKIPGESLGVALHLFVEPPGRDAVQRGEFGIEQHAMTAQNKNRARDVRGSRQGLRAGRCRYSARERAAASPGSCGGRLELPPSLVRDSGQDLEH